MRKVAVLGCGTIGRAMALDLCGSPQLEVTAVDIDRAALDAVPDRLNLRKLECDLEDPARVTEVVRNHELAVGAMPRGLGQATLRAVIEAGRPFVDACFMEEDPLELDDLARERGVTAVVDCGLTPGLANIIVGHCHARLERTERVDLCAGSLPRARQWPYQYRATIAPLDLIADYTRPARMKENGRLVSKPALSEPELLDFPGIGTLEAINADGLRTLLRTIEAPNMRAKSLRYPGHAELMRVFRESGFFSTDPVEVRGKPVVPLDLTAQLLFPHLRRPPEEDEFTVLRVIVEGRTAHARTRYTFDLFDELDRKTGTTSIARTAGYTATIVARLLAGGWIGQAGVLPPERIGHTEGLLDHLLSEMAARGVVLRGTTETWGDDGAHWESAVFPVDTRSKRQPAP